VKRRAIFRIHEQRNSSATTFLHFIPMPPMQGSGGTFIGVMCETGFLYAWIQLDEAAAFPCTASLFHPLRSN
jgi:hypothetical protein